MISYQIIEHGKPLQRAVQETPRPRGTEVLVRVTRTGICHSDLHIWDGCFDLGGGKKFFLKDRGCVPPFTMGHEPFCVVEALGPEARGVAVGDRRLVFPWIGCGQCAVCQAGRDNHCLTHRFLGISRAGAYSTHLLVPDAKYLVDTSGIDDSFAATLACLGLTVYGAIRKLDAPSERDWIAVLGCGGLGLIAIAMLAALGIPRVIACDVDEGKFAAARAAGAAHTVSTRELAAAVAELLRLAGGALAGALDFVGNPATFGLGTTALAKGGRYVLVGLFGGEVTISLPPIAQRAISITGSYTGNRRELREVVELVKTGRLKPTPVETRAASESEVNRTLEELKAGKIVGRVALDLTAAA